MGKMFHSLGLLPYDDVIETSVSDFITGYAGQSGKKTKDIFRKARGKVLFIDEAYRLNPTKVCCNYLYFIYYCDNSFDMLENIM